MALSPTDVRNVCRHSAELVFLSPYPASIRHAAPAPDRSSERTARHLQPGERGLKMQRHPKIPVDAHVHFHRRRFVVPTLDAALANFASLGRPGARLAGMLLLTESAREDVFEALITSPAAGLWSIRPVEAEPQTVIARHAAREIAQGIADEIAHEIAHEIAIVCGRQIRCAGGLEVLALGTTARYPEGREPADTIRQVRRDGAIPVFPWGFGKWLGRARAVVSELFEDFPPDAFFAGDNGGRLRLLGMPRQLRRASRSGFRVLPGTDPFPFGGDYRRVGRFGFLADPGPDPERPWGSLKDWLETRQGDPEPYGEALDPFRFAFNQSWMQVRNRIMHRGAT